MTSRPGVSVVGLGFMGERWARAVAEHPGAELLAVCDVDEAKAQRLADELVCGWSGDAHETAGGRGAEGVVLCTPEHLHTEVALTAIEADRAVAVEKPLAHDVASAARLRDAARERGTPVLAAHILRFEPRYAALHQAVVDGRIGAVQAVHTARVGVLHDQSVLRGRTSIPLYYGVHELDLARWFAGDIAAVTAERSDGVLRRAGYEVDDHYSVLLRFHSGAHGTSVLGWSLPDSTAGNGLSGFTVVGERGFLRVEQDNTGLVGFDEQGPMALDTWYSPSVHGRVVGALANEVDHFIQVVAGAAEPLCTAEDGYEAVRSSLAAEQSAAEGNTVVLDRAFEESSLDHAGR